MSTSSNNRTALTLIELLLVLSIIAILSAVAFYNLMESGTRAKVSIAKNNLRVVAGALEAFCADHNAYPCSQPTVPADPFGILASEQLWQLTTPIAYCTRQAFHDPFGPLRAHNLRSLILSPHTSSQPDPDLPIPKVVNPEQSIFYYYYPYFAGLVHNPNLSCEATALISIGPDLSDSFAVYYPFEDEMPPLAGALGYHKSVDTIYDPTNGTVSPGDIARFTGMINLREP
ncbi:prepilin-type N-terminal cleavage/methylation domain-containing protein [Candidatus Sumerlaeota bacterium]|nr:prepilin-type N-terminal cleavage/methylation domain-containing protein [Candidatus Sumerlaeota bacterium]